MAVLGKWTGSNVSEIPTTSWGNPATNCFDTEDRNDGSAYAFSGNRVTLPSSGLADGYLLIAAFEFEDTSNGRCNPQCRIVEATGTNGGFLEAYTTGYNRDNSEDRSYVRSWSIVHNPSASATFDWEWRRDSDAPTGSIIRCEFQVIPLYYSDIGLYLSTSTSSYGGTTPNQVTGLGTNLEGTNITRTGNVVTVTGDNKRYLVLGSWYMQGIGSSRTQRWGGLRVDSTKEDAAKGYAYMRNAANADGGEMFSHLIETDTADVDLDLFIYRGDGVASGQGGADNDGGGTVASGQHCLAVIELHDNAEVFQNNGSTNQNFATTGPIDIQASKVADININDAASFTRASDTGMNVEVAADILLGANVSGASQAITTGTRWTGYSEFTINGVENPDSVAGDYVRNNQSTTDTFGWSANLLGFEAVSANDDVGISATELVGSEGGAGALHSQVGWVGFLGINLDTLEPAAPSARRMFVIS